MYLQSTAAADPGMYSLPCTLFIASVAAVAIAIYKVKTKQHNDHCKNGTNKQYNYNAELAKSQANGEINEIHVLSGELDSIPKLWKLLERTNYVFPRTTAKALDSVVM